MARLSLFANPLLLGFDQIERTLESIAQGAGDGYPPYNIEQIGDHTLRITLAVAGFTEDELDVEVDENRLAVRGRRAPEDGARVYLYRGIAARQFQRSFVLAEGIEVERASLENGLLAIELARRPVERPARSVKIERAEARGGRRAGA